MVMRVVELARRFSRQPRLTFRLLSRSLDTIRGFEASGRYVDGVPNSVAGGTTFETNPLKLYFDEHREGPGIWKFEHYFEIYDRHFRKFRGRPVRVLEIGVYSGGSLRMWKEYFGPQSMVYGVDIAPECKAYEGPETKIYIGDQGDRTFWKRFKQEVRDIDIVIDDAAHTPEEQIVTIEEMLPHIRSGGVYLCEDLVGSTNWFTAYCHSLSHRLNESQPTDDQTAVTANPLQRAVHSVHHYPFVVVVEKMEALRSEMRAPKHGTEWQPYYQVK